MGTIYQRRAGGTYYGYWTDAKGRSRRASLRTKDPTVARQRLRQHELVSTDAATHSHHTLGEAIGNLLRVVEHGNAAPTHKSYTQKGSWLVTVIGNVELSTLTRDAVLLYIRQRKIAGASDSTIHKELVVLRRALHEARERKLWLGDPRAIVPSIKINYQPREVWLTPAQAKRLLAAIPEAGRRLWVALAMMAGMRLSEVERLRWEHVELAAKRIRVPGKKTAGSWRIVPIEPMLRSMLERAAKSKPAPTDRVVSRWRNVRRDLAAAVARANKVTSVKRKRPDTIPKVTPNDLRRTFASWLKQAGTDSLVVARLLGHSSTAMVDKVYGRLDEATYIEAMRAMPRVA